LQPEGFCRVDVEPLVQIDASTQALLVDAARTQSETDDFETPSAFAMSARVRFWARSWRAFACS
jgi:ABC-type transporter Mla MlaB component